ncbi:GAF domain-containing protein [Massilia arenosa]|uniref:histidine kinase n=1 Tax=Zemynaea arenosa TaxID=2561931 RepID=A0A4Y9S738_9BURK|nr:ATP-binding protein [Massilia arenosa]TFW15882.1 GAF domain-containing protein [Massilia arenosa]
MTQDHQVGLDNCANEPIHIPGLIQPHGALLVFDQGLTLAGWSDNAAALLGVPVRDGLPLAEAIPSAEARALVEACRAGAEDCLPTMVEVLAQGRAVDCVVHGAGGLVVAEFELRHQSAEEVSAYALKAHAAIERVKRHRTVDAMLQFAADQVRALTGFDRVMAYRFRHDDSGDVVAESVVPALKPFLGQRYPASDIPAQARRLYTINTLRLIADTHYAPVGVQMRAGLGPLDMSHSILRSVSPIHIEYLHNMGVGASMSISLVVNGRLWGLIACHHTGARQPAYSIRLACDILGQVLAANVQGTLTREAAEHTAQVADLRARLVETLHVEDDLLYALCRHVRELAAVLDGPALLLSLNGKLQVHGEVPEELARAVLASLPPGGDAVIQRHHRDEWPEDVRTRIGPWVGLLALNYDPSQLGWIVALRPEQVETVRWGGRPEKQLAHGPLGPRLTPRGSFDEWVETVRDSAEPWRAEQVLAAEQLLGEVRRAVMSRHAETERARMQLLAMLGHDLRDPLQTISMAASVLQQGAGGEALGQRIERSSGRMQRLISQVMDMSRLEGGAGLQVHLRAVPLKRLLEDLLDEARVAHPGTSYVLDAPGEIDIQADPDRIAQVCSNLLSNARHYGTPGQPVRVQLRRANGYAELAVANFSDPIPAASERQLFAPFKRIGETHTRNRLGLGIGLYISSEIARAHGGRIGYHYADGQVVFTVTLPVTPGAP